MEQEKKTNMRGFEGIVASDAMDKTISVLVERKVNDPKYKKQYKVSKKYFVHDEKNEAKIGDVVRFVACRPLSKNKKWRLERIIK